MGVLTPEMKAELISKAITALLTPVSDYYNKQTPPLQVAFNDAVMVSARAIVKDTLASNTEVMAKITELALQTAQKVLAMDADKMADKMADSFIASMRKEY